MPSRSDAKRAFVALAATTALQIYASHRRGALRYGSRIRDANLADSLVDRDRAIFRRDACWLDRWLSVRIRRFRGALRGQRRAADDVTESRATDRACRVEVSAC